MINAPLSRLLGVVVVQIAVDYIAAGSLDELVAVHRFAPTEGQ